MRRVGLAAALLAGIFNTWHTAHAQQTGDRVILIDHAPLKAGNTVLETLPRGLAVQIGEVRGEWLAVAHQQAGWIERRHVRPLDDAVDHFSRAIQKDSKDASLYLIRGVLWQYSGDHDRAIADFSAALRLQANDRAALANRAISWKHKGEFELALDDYNEAIRIDPTVATTWHNRGAVWLAQRNYARAANDFAEAIRLSPDQPDGYNALAWLQATCADATLRDGQSAVAHAETACRLSNYKRWNFLGTLAAAHAEAGDFDQAVAWEEKCLQLAPASQRVAVESRLRLFQVERPYRDPATALQPQTAAR